MKRYLVVAHSEGDITRIGDLVHARLRQASCQFHVLVPATPSSAAFWAWSEETAQRLARQQLAAALWVIGALGAEATGGIGDQEHCVDVVSPPFGHSAANASLDMATTSTRL